MNFKKRVNGSWTDTSHYIHNTSTDAITTLPTVIYPTDTTATVGLKGQTLQSSIPSPTSPVMPEGTGEKTGNLYFKKLAGANISDSGVIATITGFDLYIAEVEQGVQYSGNGYIYAFFEDVPAIGSISFNNSRVVESFKNIVSPINGFVAVRNPNTIQNAMCNTGNTILPYEPYGYKIPISSANTATPVYLGEVETTRKVKKLVFDGTETWNKGNYPPTGGYQFFTAMPADIATNSDWITTHFKNGIVLNGSVLNSSAFAIYLSLYPEASILPENATINDFKAWLAAQYAAGTPVTIWYVLATPETAVVNEPLMKIGDYADTLSGITIPTTAGANTISVDTTLKPSEVTVNYHGWHPVADVHERENGAWT